MLSQWSEEQKKKYIWDWQPDGMAIASLVLCWEDRVLCCANYLLGSMKEGKSRTQMALASAVGLENAYHLLVQPGGTNCEVFAGLGGIAVYADYGPLHD